MVKFSNRIGITSARTVIQTDCMDSELRNKIWNFLYDTFLSNLSKYWIRSSSPVHIEMVEAIWLGFLNERTDEIYKETPAFVNFFKQKFFKWEWFEVYDFLEFYIQQYSKRDLSVGKPFMDYCNKIFEYELSGFRFVNDILCPITSKEEIESIDASLNLSDKFVPVKTHLSQAISLLSDKTNPDYRNSIKESISAVESMAALITNDDNATLGQALKAIESKHELHPALKSAFSSLYGYTSDADGIRHKLLEEDKLKQEDAIYMLVTCSAFINYLTVKSNS